MYCKVKIKEKIYNIYYETYGSNNKEPLVILHGWGMESSSFNDVVNNLQYYVIIIDFIGFGKSDMPQDPFTLEDYVNQVEQVIKNLKLKNIIMLGHSFGGRVAIKYNYYYNLNKLILLDSAGIRHRSLSLYKKIIKYKLLKKIYFIFNKTKYKSLVKNSGSRDYRILNPIMKQTMNKIIKEDLRKYCKKTRTKTYILWGINDHETPITDAYIYHNLFYKCRLMIFYKSGHFPYLDEREKFIRIINSVIDD